MVVFPNAKINLGLNVLGRRSDNYHDISSVFLPINLRDGLEFIEKSTNQVDTITFSGLPVPGNAADNLCLKALKLVREAHKIPPLQIHLHKVIPMGAGLGGGSADGTFFIKALNSYFNIGLSQTKLKNLALQLGSDCPFFVDNVPVAVSGRGEEMEKIPVDLKGKIVVVVSSEAHISTADAYKNIMLSMPDSAAGEVVQKMKLSEWKDHLTNDFEPYAFQIFPHLKAVKETLYLAGAEFAAMTGSGSAVFGIFEQLPDDLKGVAQYTYWVLEM